MKLQITISFVLIYTFVLAGFADGQSKSPITQRQIHLAGLQVLSGPAAKQYQGVSIGIQAYFNYLNDQGGIHGRKIDYTALDTSMRSHEVQKLIKDLIFENPILAMVGSVAEPVLAAYPDWFSTYGIPDLFSVGRPQGHKAGRIYFSPSLEAEALALGRFCAENLVGKRVLVWFRDDQKATSLLEYFDAGTAGLVQIEAMPSQVPLFSLQKELDQLVEQVPDAIVVLGDTLEANAFIWQHQEWDVPIYVGSGMADMELLRQFGPKVQNRLFFLTYLPLIQENNHPGIILHRRLLNEYYPGQETTRWTLVGHAIAETMIKLLHRSGIRLSPYQLATTLQLVAQWQGRIAPPMEFPLAESAVTSFRVTQLIQNRVSYTSDWISANPAN
jgi:ABC-type branched-subunit amino acid transport system substrate-binding protein